MYIYTYIYLHICHICIQCFILKKFYLKKFSRKVGAEDVLAEDNSQ